MSKNKKRARRLKHAREESNHIRRRGFVNGHRGDFVKKLQKSRSTTQTTA